MSNVVVVKPARPVRSTYARALQYYSTNERARGNGGFLNISFLHKMHKIRFLETLNQNQER